jgi:uncharacterized membrane protein YhfC
MNTPLLLFLLISVIFPITTFIYAKKKILIATRTVITGAIFWFVFTQVLEKILHYFVFTKTNITEYPFIFAVYGGLAAGIFEEGARYIAFTKILKKFRKWKDGIGYGIGHGGIEAIYLGILIPVQVVLLTRIDPNAQIQVNNPMASFTDSLLVNAGNYGFWLTLAAERIMAFSIQIALSLLILYAVKTKRIKYLALAVVLHALLDFPAALYQDGSLNLLSVELVVFLFFLGSILFIRRSKSIFHKL